MKKLKSVRSRFEEIPSPIICDILLRLPTKACLNCKRVCKEWYSIIISLEFGALRSSRRPFVTILMYGKFSNNRKNFLLFDLDKSLKVDEKGNLNVSSEATIRFKSKFTIPHHKLYVINECNGLVCLKSDGIWTPLIVCNLLTGQEVIVEQGCKPKRKPPCNDIMDYGFGCCPVSGQFKVFRLQNIRHFRFKVEVCTIGTNEWRALGEAPRSFFSNSSVFLHGSLHKFSFTEHSIWSFQFGTEQIVWIPISDDLKTRIRVGYVDVNVFESCLCLSGLSNDHMQCGVWVMKEYGIKDSWVNLFVLDFDIGFPTPVFQIDDTTMLVSYEGGYILGISHNESGKCKRTQIHGFSSFVLMMDNVDFSNINLQFTTRK